MWICQDYRGSQLEYWAWNVPVFGDTELNARVDGLELYRINVFRIHGYTQLMVYFRPMSLKRCKNLIKDGTIQGGLIDAAPSLSKDDIEIKVNGTCAKIYRINVVKEAVSEDRYMHAYLLHIGLDEAISIHRYNKIDICIFDRDTGEKGEGSVFWREEDTVLRDR